MPNYPRCLVVGCPRSGTSLCAALIGSHPDVGMLQESLHCEEDKIIGVQIRGNKLCIPVQISLDPQPDERSVLTRLEDGVRAVLGRPRHHPSPGGPVPEPPERRVTIRTYIEDWNAGLVAIVRDPDQVIDSHVRRLEFDPSRARRRWIESMHILARVEEEYPGQVSILDFSDLTKHPERELRKVCNFLGLPFSREMIEEGARNNLFYENDSIDNSRARRDVPSYNVCSHDREAFEIYGRLIDESTDV